MTEAKLRDTVLRIAGDAGARAIGVAVHDFRDGTSWHLDGDRWFHAASTIKVGVLLGVFDAIEEGRLEPNSPVRITNRFVSEVAGRTYHVPRSSEANAAVHTATGGVLPVRELAEHMIVASGNLATNLLLEVVGVSRVQATLARLQLDGIELRRGVEDEAAWAAGINNRITANGLCRALRLIADRRAVSHEASDAMLEILHRQQFRGGIPAGLPDGARVANKTGEVSTAAHDAGIVYLEGRPPYVIAILTEWEAGADGRTDVIARVSRAVYDHVAAP